jgi:single-strand DNA-binding protein
VANVNKCLFIGRVGSDIEVREFSGAKLGRFRFVVNNRKKDQQTGEWGDVPCWIDAECWQTGNSTVVDRLTQHMKKGSAVYLEARLEYDEWQDKEGNKRSKHKLVITDWQFVEPRRGSRVLYGVRPAAPAERPATAPGDPPAAPAATAAAPGPPPGTRARSPLSARRTGRRPAVLGQEVFPKKLERPLASAAAGR